ITIPSGRGGAEIAGSSIIRIVNSGKPLEVKTGFFTFTATTPVISGWNAKESSVVYIQLSPVSKNPDNILVSSLSKVNSVNRDLAKKIFTLDVKVDGRTVPRSVQPVKMTISTKGFTPEQLANLTGVYYNSALSSYRQLGGKLSADGTTFSFYTYDSGNYGVIVSSNLSKINFAIGDKNFTKNGSSVANDVAPYISPEGKTMVPLRAMAESLGAIIAWNDATKTIAISKGSIVTRLTLGQQLPNGMGGLELQSGRTFVPIRYVAEQFEANVVWDDATNSVDIYQ
ncbi:MAG: copper amine oxidase N-terminal domain-containing protein, partial [Clostridiales bacterium]|nr:copper amine oxidase N-terminal domain-containing protein [Clostridiales bacterium]